MNIDILTKYPATIVVSRLRGRANGHLEDQPRLGPRPLRGSGENEVSDEPERARAASELQRRTTPFMYENAKRNFSSKLCYAKLKSRVSPVLNTMTVGVDTNVKYWINATGREKKHFGASWETADEYAAKLPPDGKVARLVAKKLCYFLILTSKLNIFPQEQPSTMDFSQIFNFCSDWF